MTIFLRLGFLNLEATPQTAPLITTSMPSMTHPKPVIWDARCAAGGDWPRGLLRLGFPIGFPYLANSAVAALILNPQAKLRPAQQDYWAMQVGISGFRLNNHLVAAPGPRAHG